MARRKVGTWSLALGLIGIGVIVLLHYLGSITLNYLKLVFPVIIIIFGIEIIVDRVLHPEQKRRLSVWNIVFNIIVGVCIVLNFAPGVTFGPGYLSPVKGQYKVDASIKEVKIQLRDTDLVVTGTNDSTLSYDGKVREYGTSQTNANKKIKQEWVVEKAGKTLVMKLNRPSPIINIGWSGSPSYLNVKLPQNLITKLQTYDGSIDCSHTKGNIDLQTSDGSVSARDITGDVQVHTSDGNVAAMNINGSLRGHTSDGSITSNNINGILNLHTSDGKIKANSAVKGDWTLNTSDGGIELTVPPGTNAKVQADTSDGGIAGNVNWTKKRENHGQLLLGNGRHQIISKTSDGRITVNMMK